MKTYLKLSEFLVYFFMLITLISCSKKIENNDPINGYDRDDSFKLMLVDNNNNNLLDSNNIMCYNYNNIKLFHVENGIVYEPNFPELEMPKLFSIEKNTEGEYYIFFAMSYDKNSYKSITYIQWDDFDTDTIETTYFTENRIAKKEVWLNGDKIWEFPMEIGFCFKMIKY